MNIKELEDLIWTANQQPVGQDGYAYGDNRIMRARQQLAAMGPALASELIRLKNKAD